MTARICIGGVAAQGNVFLAPMSGVTDQPFRKLVRRFGCGLVYSEMIASREMLLAHRQAPKTAERMTIEATEAPVAIQLAGCEPQVMAEAAKLVEDKGAALIDINMGCPVKKVVNGWSGSALMRDEDSALRIIEATVQAVKVPVTLKMRMGWDHASLNAPSLARKAEAAGIQLITIHGRTREQLYGGVADWAFIGRVKEQVKIPVIGNGDVTAPEHAAELLRLSGADGVMIGRGAFGKPWFPSQVAGFLTTGKTPPDPSLAEREAILLEHYDALLGHYGLQKGVRIARKHLAWSAFGIAGANAFRAAVNTEENSDIVKRHIGALFRGDFSAPTVRAA